MHNNIRKPSLLDALIPVITLIVMLSLAVYFYADNSSYGPNQIALLLAASIAGLIGLKNGHSWSDIEEGINKGIQISLGAILILLAVGSLIGTWILSGTVPTMIYYGLKLMSPSYFYAASCAVCALVALSIGSSWTVAGTLGIGLMGIASGLGLSPEVTAGAVISGAYFGDKLSPLSDTTNLAPAVSGSDLFSHIRHMLWTTIPSLFLALILFLFLGFNAETAATAGELEQVLQALESQFNLGIHLLIPMFILLFMAVKRFPAFPTIFTGAVVGAVFALIFQQDAVLRLAGAAEGQSQLELLIKGSWMAFFDGYASDTGNAVMDDLLSKGGMSGMLNTVWLIMCAMTYGGILERLGLLERLVASILKLARSTGSLIITTLGTCVSTNIVTADQYISVILPGRMYRNEYKRRGLAAVNLSRSLEDAGTISSPLIPWNTCGAYMAATLGVATFAYLPFAFFNLINLALAVIYAMVGFQVLREPTQENQPATESNAEAVTAGR
ncbi:Na+/H+ antiporter NhaC [Balneatrix alpica]|uniref:Na+/H+ antiporter NhaC n=1 Tax=Balneatrix alpica TaxID=75684 RepID=UPI002738A243|nr:Na+/H+ antiporter NhaC [Balneatrix alpica]